MDEKKKAPDKGGRKEIFQAILVFGLSTVLAFNTYSNQQYRKLNDELWQKHLKNCQITTKVLENHKKTIEIHSRALNDHTKVLEVLLRK